MHSLAGSTSSFACSCNDDSFASCVYPTCDPDKYTGTKYYDCGWSSIPNNGCERAYSYSNEPLKSTSVVCCGDGVCHNSFFGGSETYFNCSADCGYCGDGTCQSADESVSGCPTDCHGTCGDGICNTVYESSSNCYNDCGGASCSDQLDCSGTYGGYCEDMGFDGGYCDGGSGYCDGCNVDSYYCGSMCGTWMVYYYGNCSCW